MPLNLNGSGSGEDFTPFIKYDARAGKWFCRDDKQDFEIDKPVLTFDFAGIKTGWFAFDNGKAPQKVFDPSLTVAAPAPTSLGKWKRGFQLMVHGAHPIGEREFCSTAGCVIDAINLLYDVYEREGKDHPGQSLVACCDHTRPIKNKQSTNYAPMFSVRGWNSPAVPQQPGNGGLTAAGCWAAYRLANPQYRVEDAKLQYKNACESYFGMPFDHKSISAQQWAEFAACGFRKPNEESDIPF
jgi:hypothetical protein